MKAQTGMNKDERTCLNLLTVVFLLVINRNRINGLGKNFYCSPSIAHFRALPLK